MKRLMIIACLFLISCMPVVKEKTLGAFAKHTAPSLQVDATKSMMDARIGE